VAIIVPNFHVLVEWAKEHGIEEVDKAKLCEHPRVIDAIMEDIRSAGRAKNVSLSTC